MRPPDSGSTRCFSVPTLERWYYACKKSGPAALVPKPRADRGHGRCLDPELRELTCDIRTENRSASVPLILTTLAEEGRVAEDDVSPQVVRKMLAAPETARSPRRRALQAGSVGRLRPDRSAGKGLSHEEGRSAMISTGYVAFFGFQLAPFAKEIGDSDLWLPPSKEEVSCDFIAIEPCRGHVSH